MPSIDSPDKSEIWYEDPFHFIKPQEYESFGIDIEDISPGTIPARRHPSYLPGRFGGNAYGLGFYELYERLSPDELAMLDSISGQNVEELKEDYKKINNIYKKMGLLIRLSSKGKIYYLIPDQLIISTIDRVKIKADEIGKIIEFHRYKYLKETYRIGLITQEDDIIGSHLLIRFKEHEFYIFDSLEKLINYPSSLDMVIFTRDIFEIIQAGRFIPVKQKRLTKRVFEQYAIYLLSRIYRLLNEKGEIFIISEYEPPVNGPDIKVRFKSEEEYKRFLIFTHIFKTKKRYRELKESIYVNMFDLRLYLRQPYVEHEVIHELLGKREPESLNLEEIDRLPYLNYPVFSRYRFNQYDAWNRVFSVFYEKVHLKEITPESVLKEWKSKFEFYGSVPPYLLIFLGQKRPSTISIKEIKKETDIFHLTGSPSELVSEHRDSFQYIYDTLNCLNLIKEKNPVEQSPPVLLQRLKQPFDRPLRRHKFFNDVLKLLSRREQLKKIEGCLNPDHIEGPITSILSRLELLQFFGLSRGEIREIFLIISGHSPMVQIVQGKSNLKSMKPIADALKKVPLEQAIHLLRYCRLMSVAEGMALKGGEFDLNQLNDIFEIFEVVVMSLTEKGLDWDFLIDSYITNQGGMKKLVVKNILKMMNNLRYLDKLEELKAKGFMEKESLADYDLKGIKEIDNVISLINTVEEVEERFLRDDPLNSPAFYRKFLNSEFHGTGTLFEFMNGRHVYILLWIVINVSEGEIINFNPLLKDMDFFNPGPLIKKIEREVASIKLDHVQIKALKELREHLYKQGIAFIMGTGIQLRLDSNRNVIDVDYIDIDNNIKMIEGFLNRFPVRSLKDISDSELMEISNLFNDIEIFYNGHLNLIQDMGTDKFPPRQLRWIKRIEEIRRKIKRELRSLLFKPDTLFDDMDRLYRYSPELFRFIFPELSAMERVGVPGSGDKNHLFYILNSLKKLQALINKDRRSFHDIGILHKLARKEFGPMDSGILGLSDSQISELENIVDSLRKNGKIFSALMRSIVFRDVGLIQGLRKRYEKLMNPVNHAEAGVLFIQKENLGHEYNIDNEICDYMLKIIRYHDYLRHMVEGEFSLYSVQDIIDTGNKELFDAIFICSFLVFYARSNDLILEDLMEQLIKIRRICHRILDGGITLEAHLQKVYARRGQQYSLLTKYLEEKGYTDFIPDKEGPARDIHYQTGRLLYGMERLFRLRGAKHVEFIDLANYLMKMPLRYIYKKRRYYGVGYSRFERELFESYRIYGSLMRFPEYVRFFILNSLVEDQVRIWGFREVSMFTTYENQLKLLFIALMGTWKIFKNDFPANINFYPIAKVVDRRFEIINEVLRGISVQEIWDKPELLNGFLKGRNGILLRLDMKNRVLNILFKDRMDIEKRIKHIYEIDNLEQLKNYYHYSLRTLRKSPYLTDDYELALEKAYEQRLREILEHVILKARDQMHMMKEPGDVKRLRDDLLGRALEMGLTSEQKDMINDIYELRQEEIKREKLTEILTGIKSISNRDELKDYWDSIKWYLYENRPFLGKEFEILVAREFDKAYAMLS